MSVKSVATWAPLPSTERGKSTQLSVDNKGERLAYANNKSIFLRSIDDPSISTQYTQHTATTTVARFSPSGYYVASGDIAGNVRVWDCMGEGGTKGVYQITRSINDLAWDGDSQRIIAVGDGKERFGHCITADSGNSVGEISGHTSQINSVAIRQQRPLRAATGSDDTSVVFYHGAPFKFNTSLRGQHNRFIYGVAFSPDGASLVSVGADKRIWLYDGKTGDVKSQISNGEHKGSIFAVSWSKDSKRFVTSSADQTVKIWDVEAGRSTQTWRLGEEGVVSIQDHQVGVVWPPARSDSLIISLSLSGNLNYLTEGTRAPQRIIQGHQKNITALATSPSSRTLWTGSAEGRVCSWDIGTATAETTDGESHTNYVSGLSEHKGTVSSIGWDDTIRSIDASAKTFTGGKSSTEGQPRSVATSGSQIVVATHKGVEVFSSGKQVISHATKFSPACIAAHDTTIAVGGDDSALHIFSLASTALTLVTTISSPSGPLPTSLSFSPSGAHLAAGYSNGKITVYDASSASSSSDWNVAISRWSSHTGRVTSIAWRADGKYAVSGALDTSVFVWSVEKPGMRISAPNAHKEGVNGVAWEGNERVLSVGMDAAVKVWDVVGL